MIPPQSEEWVDLVQLTIKNYNMSIELSKNSIFKDERGLFFPLSISGEWVQSNISISKMWTFRGLHHQRGKTAQKKKITVIKGSILDVVVDLHMGNFTDTKFFKLLPGDTITIPAGYAHGFLALEENTMIQYLVDRPYSPGNEISFDWKSVETVKELILAEIGDEDFLSISQKDKDGKQLVRDYVETKETLER